MFNVAERINEICKKRNISSVSELARITGVRQSTLQDIISGEKRSPRTDTIERICNGLGITLSDFFIDDQIKQQVSNDLFPILAETIKTLDLPREVKDAALDKLSSLPDSKKQELLPQLVQSIRAAEDAVYYRLDGSLSGVMDKYKSLPEDLQKALSLVIASLRSR